MANARVDFDPKAFQTLVAQKGYDLTWEKHIYCPCLRSTTGQPKIKCPLCGGRSSIWIDPIDIRGLIFAEMLNVNQFTQPGEWQRGSARLTVQGDKLISYYDRITLLESITTFSETVERGEGTDTDRLNYKALEFVYIRDETTIYDPATDAIIDENGDIKWIDGQPRPEDKARYTIRYSFHPTYLIMELDHTYRDTLVKRGYGVETPQKLPRAAIIQLDFLIEEKRGT